MTRKLEQQQVRDMVIGHQGQKTSCKCCQTALRFNETVTVGYHCVTCLQDYHGFEVHLTRPDC